MDLIKDRVGQGQRSESQNGHSTNDDGKQVYPLSLPLPPHSHGRDVGQEGFIKTVYRTTERQRRT